MTPFGTSSYPMETQYSRQFTSLNISSSYQDDAATQYPYEEYPKSRKTSWWRWWKQRSRFQRTMIYLMGLLCIVALILLVPTFSSKHSVQQVISIRNKAQSSYLREALPQVRVSQYINDLPKTNEKQIPFPTEKEEINEVEKVSSNDAAKPTIERHANSLVFNGPENDRQREVVKAFQHAWKGYKAYAWGHDHLKPLTKTYHDWFGLALTIVDSIDTLYIMNLEEEYQEARTFVAEQLNLNVNKDVNFFETTIRVLGGFLGAYYLSKDDIFLQKAIEIGDLLLPGFKSGSGVPYSDVNLFTHHAHAPRWGPDSSVSEVSTVQLEFKELSRITGDSKYEEAADKVTEIIHGLPKTDGLVPIYINAETGKFRPFSTITLGARGDSYYEYLLKQWLHTGKSRDFLIRDYNESVSGIMKHLVRTSEPNKLVFVGELTSGKNFRPKMDHLTCYLPSVLALGTHNGLPLEHLKLAEKLMYTCYQMYAQMPTFLSPEIVHFNMVASPDPDIFVKVNDAHNLLRPETVESLWYLYHLTRNHTYQDWGWRIFQAFEKYTKVEDGGYTTIDNVKNTEDTRPRDMMESFFLSETLKYFYLLFSDDQSVLALDKHVFNSEAHPLPIHES